MRADPSGRRLTEKDASLVKGMAARNDRHHDIAAWFGVNQGRIAEVLGGSKFSSAPIAKFEDLPPPGPYSSGETGHKSLKALEATKLALELALKDVDVAIKDIKRSK